MFKSWGKSLYISVLTQERLQPLPPCEDTARSYQLWSRKRTLTRYDSADALVSLGMEIDDPWEWRLIFLCLLQLILDAISRWNAKKRKENLQDVNAMRMSYLEPWQNSCIWPLSFAIQKLIFQIWHHPSVFPPGIWLLDILYLRFFSTRGNREGSLQAKLSCPLLTTEDLLWQHASANVFNSRFGITCKFGVKLTTENRDGNKDGRGGAGCGRVGQWWAVEDEK